MSQPFSIPGNYRILITAMFFLITAPCFADDPTFEADVLPILTKNCLGCHGGLRQRAELDMRTIPSLLKGGKSGTAAKSGHVDASLMWKRIVADEMPKGEDKLKPADKKIIRDWIAVGMPTLVSQQKDTDPLLPAGKRHDPQQVAKVIDQHISLSLSQQKLQASEKSSDAEFLRRVTLDITGRIPTAEQAKTFLDSKDPDKRAKLIDDLLKSPNFGEQFGRTWREWICPPELPSDANGGRQPHNEARELGKWFADRFNANDSWDKITRELLTTNGEIRKNPQTIFYGLVGQGGKVTADGSAKSVGSLFLGVQLQCAQCHDDPYRDWAQKEFWGMAAFFGNTKGDFRKVEEKAVKRTNKPVSITIPREAFSNAGNPVEIAFLRSKADLPDSGTLRPKLVDWMTNKDNPYFAKAFANRMWFYLFARGIVNPVDDMRDLNPPSHPGLLTLLANEFKASDYDVKHLIRCICNSDAYQRSSKVKPGTDRETIVELNSWFGRMPLRIMTADMMYDSLKLAYGDDRLDLRAINPKDGNTSGESAPVADAYLEFLRTFGTNEDDATDFTHGIPQMLAMINHPRLLEGSKALEEHLKAKPAPSPEQTVDWLYLSTLSRRPTESESLDAVDYVNRSKDRNRAYVGVLWMLVNRSEFMFVR